MTNISSEANESDGQKSMASTPLSSLELSKRAVVTMCPLQYYNGLQR
jgi:hypothetical protein